MAHEQTANLFPKTGEIAGWDLKSGPRVYADSQLFDYMDGAAEIPKSYGFRTLSSARYTRAGVTLEAAVFDMGSAASAFGFYSARVFLERSPRSKERIVQLDHPAHLYAAVGVLTLWKDRYTVILQPDDGKPEEHDLLAFARFISARIARKGSEPALLQRLPASGLIQNTARYVKGKAAFDSTVMFTPKDVFGMAAGPPAVAAEYTVADATVTLAVIAYETSAGAASACAGLSEYLKAGKGNAGKSAIHGAILFSTPGRAKCVSAVAHGSELLLSVGASSVAGADKALAKLLAASEKR